MIERYRGTFNSWDKWIILIGIILALANFNESSQAAGLLIIVMAAGYGILEGFGSLLDRGGQVLFRRLPEEDQKAYQAHIKQLGRTPRFKDEDE